MTILTDSRSVAADVYCATQIDRSLRPFDWYLGLVLDGAIEHGLPARYVAGIEAVTADIDPNADRRQANFAILRSRLPLVRVAGLG